MLPDTLTRLKETEDPDLLRAALTQAFLGGRDTTSGLLTNLWFQLARRPDVWGKLEDEIAFLQGRKPTTEELKQLKYLQWCLNEGKETPKDYVNTD